MLFADVVRDASNLGRPFCETGNGPGTPQFANGAVIRFGVQEGNRMEGRLPAAEDKVESGAFPLPRRHDDVEL